MIELSVEFGARSLLGAVFVVAGAAKLADIAATRQAVMAFGVPTRLVVPASVILSVGEIALGAAFLLGSGSIVHWAALAALGLLTTFSIVVVRALYAGDAPPCRCFGGLTSATVTHRLLVRNGLLAALAAFVVWSTEATGAPGSFISVQEPSNVLGLGILVISIIAAAASMVLPRRRPGRSLPRSTRRKARRKTVFPLDGDTIASSSAVAEVTGHIPALRRPNVEVGRYPISRRKAIGLFLLGVMPTFMGRTTPWGVARPSRPFSIPASATLPDPNVRDTTCAEFNAHANSVGVRDSNGDPHPTYHGWTNYRLANDALSYSAKQTQAWICPCKPDVVFESQSECESKEPCKPGLGGCLQKCGGGGVCLETPPLRANWTVTPLVQKLTWLPPRPEKALTAECKAEVSRHSRHVDRHEQRHADDLKAIEDEFNKKAPKSYRACGKTVGEAKSKLDEKIAKDIADARKEFETKSNKRRDDFHGTIEGGPVPPINCDVCR